MDPDPAGQPGSHDPAPGEFRAIARWTASRPAPVGVLTGPGDDAAWLRTSGPVALSVDTVVEGVHFRFDWSRPEDVGWKAVAAALSDLAASRAHPRGALLALSCAPGELAPAGRADAVMRGALEALDVAGCALLGGDTVRTDGPLTLSVTVVGEASGAGPLLRSGAQVGDLLQVSGPTGFAAWAVACWTAGLEPPAVAATAHRRPLARLDLLDALRPATAGIDVSDGLLADAAWLARASGVALELDRDACLAGGAPDPAHVLSGGDDYEVLATAPAPLAGFRTIGAVREGPPALRWSTGATIAPAGWDHGGDC